ncbi:ENTH-domain-containing protein [Hymenopellis radicata]|nr:ENTH-domain-containing protein [Hymenopellis radicata]
MQHFGKSVIRVTKNYTKGYSDTQSKVRDATSNDPWGPSGTQMNEIAQLTYNQGDFVEIMEMLDKRLNDKGKNWRHVFKSLTVLDYCLHQGSENVVIYFRDNVYIIKTLKEFQYIDEEGKDQGANVRQKAKDITSLLVDEGRLRQERRARASMRDRMIRGGAGESDETDPTDEDENLRRRTETGRRSNKDEDDLRKAIEESKRSLAKDQQTAEERDLQEALRLSREEEEKRKNAVEDSNAAALFDDQNQLAPPNQFNNNPFPTMSDPTPYTVGLQPQFTQQLQPQFTAMQPQFTSFNPYQQQAEQEAEYLRQQQQQQYLLQQQAANDEWMRQQLLLQQQQQQQNMFMQPPQPLTAQPTGFGSNNPFAPQQPSSPIRNSPMPPPSFNLQGTYENNNGGNFTNNSTPSGSDYGRTPSPAQRPAVHVPPRKDENAHLASLFANRDDGQDTFGNVGALRFGQQAGGMVNQGALNQGNNPFGKQQQQSNEQPFFSV